MAALTVLAVAAALGAATVPALSAADDLAAHPAAAATPLDAPAGRAAAPLARTVPAGTPAAATSAAALGRPAADPQPLVEDRDQCSPEFVACVDLRTQQAWLQHGPTVTYGPVPFMPGTLTGLAPPGPDSSATPTGAFAVLSKNATQVSTEFHEPMPDAVFFAAGGIAFHQGSLAASSHGCIHLSERAAAAFFDDLGVGDPVLVF